MWPNQVQSERWFGGFCQYQFWMGIRKAYIEGRRKQNEVKKNVKLKSGVCLYVLSPLTFTPTLPSCAHIIGGETKAQRHCAQGHRKKDKIGIRTQVSSRLALTCCTSL